MAHKGHGAGWRFGLPLYVLFLGMPAMVEFQNSPSPKAH